MLQVTEIATNKYYWNVLEEAFSTIQSAVVFFLKDGTKDWLRDKSSRVEAQITCDMTNGGASCYK